jgi:hypothetical protein
VDIGFVTPSWVRFPAIFSVAGAQKNARHSKNAAKFFIAQGFNDCHGVEGNEGGKREYWLLWWRVWVKEFSDWARNFLI